MYCTWLSCLEQCLGLSLSFLAFIFSKSTSQLLVEYMLPKQEYYASGTSQCTIIRRHPVTVCPIQVMLTLSLCLRWCPRDFFTEKLQFSLFPIDNLWRHTMYEIMWKPCSKSNNHPPVLVFTNDACQDQSLRWLQNGGLLAPSFSPSLLVDII